MNKMIFNRVAHAAMIMTVLLGVSSPASALVVNPKFLKKIEECPKVEKAREVLILKQWHLSPGVNTHTPSTRQRIPQTDNQLEIYRQLEEWVKTKKVDTVIVEGCQGELDEHFKPMFYGWKMKTLIARAKQKNFNAVLAHPGMKLKAQFKNRVKVLCGDSMTELKRGDLALSDARADVGYLTRLMQYKNDPARAKPYLEGVIESFHLSPKTSVKRALSVLTADIKKSLARVEDSMQKRNEAFVETIHSAATHKPIPVVIGGLHAKALRALLEKNKKNCEVDEPVSYEAQEEKLREELEEWLKKH